MSSTEKMVQSMKTMKLMLDDLNDFICTLSLQITRVQSELSRLSAEFDNPRVKPQVPDGTTTLYDRAMDAMENGNTGYETAAFRDGHGIERAALTAEEAGTILHLNQHSGGFGGVTPDGENLRKMISDNVRSSAKLLENIRNLCEQLNKKVEESART